MTSIRKAKKWYKSCINSKNEYEKKLGTIRKCPTWRIVILCDIVLPKGRFVRSQYG